MNRTRSGEEIQSAVASEVYKCKVCKRARRDSKDSWNEIRTSSSMSDMSMKSSRGKKKLEAFISCH